jgi:hypothetical protein
MSTTYARIKNLTRTPAEWQSANPILLVGETGYEKLSDGSYKMKIGDGVTNWNNLSYAIDFQALQQAKEDAVTAVTEAEELVLTVNPDVALLFNDYIQNTSVATTTNGNGDITQVVHSRSGTTLRTDVFTYSGDLITETRTLQSGKYITIQYNAVTLAVTISEIHS